MTLSILLLVCAGLCSVIVGVAVGHVERRGYSLVRYQLLNCAVCDFGRDAFGWAEVAAPAGEYVVRLGEKIGADGRIDLDPGGTRTRSG